MKYVFDCCEVKIRNTGFLEILKNVFKRVQKLLK